MNARTLVTMLRRALHRHRWLQLGLVVAIWSVGNWGARLGSVPVPGSVVGLLLALALLASGALRLESVRGGANWLLGEMMLFFVPAVLAILDHHELWGLVGLKVLVAIFFGTAAVMGVTAAVVEVGSRLGASSREADHAVE